MNISNNISSIMSHQTMMNTNANNIANANSERFVPSDTKMSNESGTSVRANVRQSIDNGSLQSQTNLAREIPDQIVVQNATELNVSAIKTQNEMLGSLLDIKV